ncbi:uncharacterized protein LOC117180244 [Belonocnema kinseyi]|uniref:uncharacterized protein LOC117180244 n=1 Tax=Belonocnema kinseyi TaxID=2817044 RepID=UPI00143E097A|nr:uncharacterized protein LOC117180244 [Belonocnema kinseyi]
MCPTKKLAVKWRVVISESQSSVAPDNWIIWETWGLFHPQKKNQASRSAKKPKCPDKKWTVHNIDRISEAYKIYQSSVIDDELDHDRFLNKYGFSSVQKKKSFEEKIYGIETEDQIKKDKCTEQCPKIADIKLVEPRTDLSRFKMHETFRECSAGTFGKFQWNVTGTFPERVNIRYVGTFQEYSTGTFKE